MPAEDDFPVDDLPLPKPGKSRVAMTATERLAQGGTPPPPPPVITGGDTASAATAVVDPTHDGDDTPERKAATGKAVRKRQTRRQAAASAEASTAGTGDCAVSLPRSVFEKANADSRSRANLLRAAFEKHAPAVADAHPPRPAPRVEGMRPSRPRREPAAGDPFIEVLFKLRSDEKALLDEWVAKTTLTRSAFVTELIQLELG